MGYTTAPLGKSVKIGQTLPNGALLLAVAENKGTRTTYCLALAHPNTDHAQFVTWAIGGELHTFWGEYFLRGNLADALASLHSRAGVTA